MRRFWVGAIALAATLTAALVATLPTAVGAELWHYNLAFAVTVVVAALARPLWRRRRFATLATAITGTLATVTGFGMVYTKEFAYKDWLTWWHSVTSVALLLAFLAHWLNNQPRLWSLAKRLFEGRGPTLGHAAAGAWLVLVGAGAWSGLPGVRGQFTTDNYLGIVSWTVLAGVVLTYGLWLLYRLPAMRARLAGGAHRTRARALVDTSLFLAHWGALLTGFALLYFADFLRGGDFKYVSKWWHTATSVAFVAVVVIHVGFNARLVAAHARRVDQDLR